MLRALRVLSRIAVALTPFSQPATPAPVGAAPAGDLVKDSSLPTFMQDVVQPSMQVPVLVDFWAPWCGPCKTLGPMLEKIVRNAGGKVRLVKVNIDDPQNQPLAQQLRIQSIPAVYAFHKGQPVDGFVGALPESQLKQFVESVMGGKVGPDPIQLALEDAKAALEEGDVEAAAQIYVEVLQAEPANGAALGGLAKAQIALGDIAAAEATLAGATPEAAKHAEVAAAAAALELARQTQGAAGELAPLKAKVEAEPGNHQARYDLALALLGANDREGAMEQLLDLFKRDRNWNEGAAKAQLLKLFEAWGFGDALSVEGRRRLSAMMFA